ncbi:hypothetical protein [Thalassospira profundimaris]|uniref:hypothetical protein n=1 Tax=Thalassospira profundimaris TaxID=502049 RepID=UPI0002873F1D|nr:hypothetical protein [Thalassospira profundimaris]EKF06791.1 hypothetical protein TH2_18214 [Thalassospira profundimaris WP0211]
MVSLKSALSSQEKPALLIGNGINIHGGNGTSNWDGLLDKLARRQGLEFTSSEREEMSNTEFFDILDLAKPYEDRETLQSEFCDLMKTWQPTRHHERIANWALRNKRPIVTVNFDENFSRSINADFYRSSKGFTDFYPWSSYFSDRRILRPREEFAIWHAHGMMRYRRSIRLGLTHYMGAVQRARAWVYSVENSLRARKKLGAIDWQGSDTWLDILFFSPVLIFGFSFGKDENFMRWLFLERAKLQKIASIQSGETWFVEKKSQNSLNRKAFFERLGMRFITVESYAEIYEDPAWML